MVTPVTGFRIPEEELDLLDECKVDRTELVRFLIVSGLGGAGGDLGLVADVLTSIAENGSEFSREQEELLFRTACVLRSTGERYGGQTVLQDGFSEVEGVNL